MVQFQTFTRNKDGVRTLKMQFVDPRQLFALPDIFHLPIMDVRQAINLGCVYVISVFCEEREVTLCY